MPLSRRDLLLGGAAAGSALLLPGLPGRAAAAGLPSLRPGGPPRVGGLRVLAGSLHDHSTDSDGDSRSEDVAAFLFAHREELGIDYCVMTDHSDFFPGSPLRETGNPPAVPPVPVAPATYPGGLPTCGRRVMTPSTADAPVTPVPDLWHRQEMLSAQYASPDFSFLRGFEWTNDQENHLDVLLSQNWTSRAITGDGSMRMTPFWTWLGTQPVTDPTSTGLGFGGADGIGCFNHPGDKGVLNWDDYAWDAAAAQRMSLIEIHGDYGRTGRGVSDAGWLWWALSRGWVVSPVMNWDWHEWQPVLANPTIGGYYENGGGSLPGQRSLVLATDATAASMRQALLARRTTATEIPDLWAALRGPGGEWQGSVVAAEPGSVLRLTVDAGSPTEPLTGVQIVSDNGLTGESYFYGDNPDYMANHSQLTPSYVEQHARFVASGGKATRKQTVGRSRYDAPPPGTVVAAAPLRGARDSVVVEVPVPTAPSPRPDGMHFYYAIVSAGPLATPARAWTGPLFSQSLAPSLPESPVSALLPVAGVAAAAVAVHALRARTGGESSSGEA